MVPALLELKCIEGEKYRNNDEIYITLKTPKGSHKWSCMGVLPIRNLGRLHTGAAFQ